MCLIVFAWKVLPGMPLIAAANRDEFYERASMPAGSWPDHPQIYAGRDLKGGGSWMGIAQATASPDAGGNTRFAAITNVRCPKLHRDDAPSRGALVTDYLAGSMTAADYVEQIRPGCDAYNGFNLVLGDRDTLIWFSNRGLDDPRNGQPLAPGIYGLSNALLDAPWPKVLKAKAEFASLLCLGAPEETFFEMLADTARAPDSRLPDTGVPLDVERALSSVCIDTPGYGTRTSTIVKLYSNAPAQLHEVLVQ